MLQIANKLYGGAGSQIQVFWVCVLRPGKGERREGPRGGGFGEDCRGKDMGHGAQLQGHRVGRDELGIEAGVEEEKLVRTEMGGRDRMVPVGWSGLCLGPRLGCGKSSEREENPMADSF